MANQNKRKSSAESMAGGADAAFRRSEHATNVPEKRMAPMNQGTPFQRSTRAAALYRANTPGNGVHPSQKGAGAIGLPGFLSTGVSDATKQGYSGDPLHPRKGRSR